MSAARGFTAIPNSIIRDGSIPPSTRLLYGVIMSYAWGSRTCTASADTLCDDTGIGRSAFFEGIALLRERGLLEVEKRKSKNGWRNVYVPVAKGVEIPDLDDGGGPGSGQGVVRNPDEGSSATRTQKKTKEEEESSADASDREKRTRASDPREQLPDGFPAELVPHARHVFRVLRSVAQQHNAREVTPRAVGLTIMGKPGRRYVEEAHAMAAWAQAPPRPILDVVGTYRTWLGKAEVFSGVEHLDDDGRITTGPARPPAGVTPIRRGSNADAVQANLDALDEMERRLGG